MKHRFPAVLAFVSLFVVGAFLFYISDSSPIGLISNKTSPAALPEREPMPEQPAVATLEAPELETQSTETLIDPASATFSPEMARLVSCIESGQSIRFKVGERERDYIFRPQRVTADGFQVSAGANAVYPSQYAVYQGKQILADGSLTEMAKLAVVNDTFSMAYTTDKGDFLIEENDEGEWESRTLLSREEGSRWGHFQCDEENGLAGIVSTSEDAEEPPREAVSIRLGAEVEESATEPQVEGARASHPYFRLGEQYDASLKDILILMISSKSQTGTNLSSKAATYFSYAATAADVYERQLGLRYLLQELILIPSTSTEDDIEPAANNPADNGTDDLAALKSWCDTHRPQATYKWGHAMGWTLVEGENDTNNWVGWAWIDNYGSSENAFSVNEPRWTWGVHIHELGHNVGASHTIGSGGAMNPTVSRSNPKEDFFKESENGSYTAAMDIYNYMSSPSRNYVFGPAELRNPEEMPFGIDDAVSTATDTPVTFNPLSNDDTATLFGATNNIRLIEVGQIYPKLAGSVSVSGNEITFTPVGGFTGNVWFSYTLSGDVGTGSAGWLHSADVVVTVGGISSDPGGNPTISTTSDVLRTDFSGDIRINPLLNDEGKGRLWAGGVEAHNFDDGSLAATNGSFHLVSASVVTGNGTVTLETAEVTRNGINTQDNTGYLVYTPGGNEPSQVVINYTVEDADGNQSTGTIYLTNADTVSVSSDLSQLIERDGRVATLTFTRTGATTSSEWIDFGVTGEVTLTGSGSDVALSGFISFNADLGVGRLTLPAGQASVSLQVSAMEDVAVEGAESLNVVMTNVETLLIDPSAGIASVEVIEFSPIETVVASEDFDGFSSGTSLGNGWTNEATSPGVWTADSAGTGSSNTGPSADHTLGTSSGVYLYREASNNTNEQADLTSPTIDLSGVSAATVEFYYHMYGEDMGELRVDVYSGGSWNLDVFPVLTGQQQTASEDPWIRARFDVSPYTTADFQVRFRGITGSSFTSDMAIDGFVVGETVTPTNEGPFISGQPQSLNVVDGDPAYISVVAQAYPSPTYQWKKDGIDISGATQSVLYFAAATQSDAAEYTCIVTSGGTVTSTTATLTLPIVPPTGLAVTPGSTSVTLDWDDSTHPNFSSYSVYRSETAGSYSTPLETDLTSSSYVDNSVMDGTSYYYVVTTLDTDTDESSFSNETSVDFYANLSAPYVDAGPDQVAIISASVTWTPAQLTTTAWYDASDSGTLTETGGAISQWDDKSGNGLNLQASASQEPINGTTTINGTNAIDFDGNNDQMSTSSNPFGSAVSDALVIMVHKVNNDSDQGTIFTLTGSDASGSRWQSHAPYNGTAYFDCGGTGSANRINTNYGTDTGDNVLVSFYGSTTDNVQQIFKNGSLLIGDTSGHSVNTVGNLFLGSGANSAYQDTTIGEVIIINGTVSLEDRQNLEGYLAHKWGLDGDLPVDHPYKAAAPGGAGASVDLAGSVTDADGGTPPTTTWTKVSGRGSVIFGNDSAVDTSATFSELDTYVLRLTADDGVFQTTDDITITIANSSDSDDDGMDDAWEIINFEDLLQGAGDDFDGDGVVNILERALGAMPNDATSMNLPSVSIINDDGNDYPIITYRRLTGGSGTTGVDYTADGLTYVVEYDTDLTDPWNSGSVVQVGSATDNGDGITETVTVRLTTRIDAETIQFLRLKVTKAP